MCERAILLLKDLSGNHSLVLGTRLAPRGFDMKHLNPNSNHDQNWQWPEKTWFRERLNALKARENELRRKPLATSERRDVTSPPETSLKAELKVD